MSPSLLTINLQPGSGVQRAETVTQTGQNRLLTFDRVDTKAKIIRIIIRRHTLECFQLFRYIEMYY